MAPSEWRKDSIMTLRVPSQVLAVVSGREDISWLSQNGEKMYHDYESTIPGVGCGLFGREDISWLPQNGEKMYHDYESTIPGAGCGLWSLPTPTQDLGAKPHCNMVIRKNNQVCLYAKYPLAIPVEQLPTVACVEAVIAHLHLYIVSTYDGSNTGSFANGTDLLPGLKRPWSTCPTDFATEQAVT